MPNGPEVVELARIWRGPVVESMHHGVVTVADTGGRLRHAWGDPGWTAPPRSALKPFQAIALVESGAADALGLTDEHIALACASHAAQPFQVALVGDWLGRLGLTEDALICGPALPRDLADQGSAFAHGGPRRIYHNCSGKHCGFLSVARHLNAGLDYADPDHPAQKLYRDILSEFTGLDADRLPYGVDHCGLPAIALPAGVMAKAWARFGVGQAVSSERRAAARRVLNAMLAHPDHLSATDSPLARMIRYCDGNVVAKTGAEGYLAACVRDRGLGIVIKVADGDNSGRARMGVLARILGRIGALPTADAELLVAAVEPAIADSNGREVGRVEITIQPPQPKTPTQANLGFWLSGTPVEGIEEYLPKLS
ncbi:asparaginase [Falsiroseomonas oryziterrae]|uniref:asparaginase n=1 Tax=Falsiroseomonas oryziterrae TaxID=2911368 RepID=UPI001F3E1FC3|nr:asparaginase [Roseomonas sp. NPKOSM-4]